MEKKVSIDSQDVIKLILQYLKENNLTDSLAALQGETGIACNIVADKAAFLAAVRYGRWADVLQEMAAMKLPLSKQQDVYEEVLWDLVEAGEHSLAKEVLLTADPLQALRGDSPARYQQLLQQTTAGRGRPDGKEARRRDLATALGDEVQEADPSRLMTLLQQSVLFQAQSTPVPKEFDLFRGASKSRNREQEKLIKHSVKLTANVKLTPVTLVLYSPSGDRMLVGTHRGYELCDAEGQPLDAPTGPVPLQDKHLLCGCFSKDGDHVALGAEDGSIGVVRLSAVSCPLSSDRLSLQATVVKSFPSAHTKGISSLAFARDGRQLLSSSFDSTARIHGFQSGKTIQTFRGHSSYVNSAVYCKANVMTASSDGTVCLWDVHTAECLVTYRHPKEVAMLLILPVPSVEHFVVGTHSNSVLVFNASCQLLISLSSGSAAAFLTIALSPQGKWLYAAAEDKVCYVFDLKAGLLEEVVSMEGDEVLQLAHHPQRNLLAALQRGGQVKMFSG